MSALPVDELRQLIVTVIDNIRHTSRASGFTLPLSASAGVVEGVAGDTVDLLLRNADTAAYQAKRRGRGRVEVFDQSLRAATVRTHRLMVELERAFTEGELTAWYQPVVSLVDGMMRGAEALVRWQHPQHGWLEPAAFMPAIVQAGLSSELGLHMMQTVMQQQRRLADLPVHGLKIDGSFIAGLPADDNSRAIVEATLGLGARLGLRVMAEGVETLGQHHWLLDHDCEMGQGFLYGAPMPAAQLEVGVAGYVQRRLYGVSQEPKRSDKTLA